MIRPGVNVVIKELPPVRSAPTDTGVWFTVGTSDQGPLYPVLVQSLSEFVTNFGTRQTYSPLYDALDTYFREGGRQAYVQRVVGPAPVYAFKNLLDSGAGISLVATAIGPGSYGNSIKVGVGAGAVSGFQIIVQDINSVVIEQSTDLADQAAAINWGAKSAYIRIALGATALVPAVVAPAVMATGTDDRVNITDTQWLNALTLHTKDLGPGQVSAPGRTTTVGHTQLIAHAVANNRVAIMDSVDTPTVATHTAAAAACRTDGRWGGLFAPWDVIQGVVINTYRTVPPCARICGNIARNNVLYASGQAAAGEFGQANYVIKPSQVWIDTDRQTLNAAGINVSITKFGGVRTYGWRSCADPNLDPYWIDLGSARTIMAYSALGSNILETHLFEEIDGQGRLFGRIEGQLIALANQFYLAGDLFGDTPDQAFNVVCDTSNNTPTTIANHELHATAALRTSEFAELIEFDLVKVPVNQPVVQ